MVASSFDSFVFDVKSIKMSHNNYRYYFVQFGNNTNIVFYRYGANKCNIHILAPLTHTQRETESMKIPLHSWYRAQPSKPEHTWLP
jgi:hypothetical protein